MPLTSRNEPERLTSNWLGGWNSVQMCNLYPLTRSQRAQGHGYGRRKTKRLDANRAQAADNSRLIKGLPPQFRRA